MKNILRIFTLCLILSSGASASETCPQECQTRLINAYYAGINKIMMAESTIGDIDGFMNSLHDDVQYIHAEYGADFNKEAWRAAFVRSWKKGRYDNPKEAVTTVTKIIHGHKFAAVEFISRHKNKDTGELVVRPARLAMFGFKDGAISHVRDYWYHSTKK